MPVFALDKDNLNFPHPEYAEEDGLLAVGGDLSIHRLITAYSYGIFPWYSAGQEIMWWFTNPRCILIPEKVKVQKNMKRHFNQNRWQLKYDTKFEEVIRRCAEHKRTNQDGTWITKEMQKAYCDLHEAGFAHSVEVYEHDELIAGLYGVDLGKIFFGESMFTTKTDASKFALITLAQKLVDEEYILIDCQQETGHVMSMGAEMIDKNHFLNYLEINRSEKFEARHWK